MNQSVDIRSLWRALKRRKWVIITGATVGLIGSLLWLSTQRSTVYYVATAKLISTEKSENESKNIIPQYGYMPFNQGQSRMSRVAADVMSSNLLMDAITESGALFKITDRNNTYTHIYDFKVLDNSAAGRRYTLEFKDGKHILVKTGSDSAWAVLDSAFVGLGLAFRVRSDDAKQGNMLEFVVLEPDYMSSLLQKRGLSVHLTQLSQNIGQSVGQQMGISEPLVMNITVSWDEPWTAAALANAIAHKAIEYNLNRKKAQYAQSKEFIQEQMKSYSQELTRLANEIRLFKERTGISDIDAQHTELVRRLSEMDATLAEIDMEERNLSKIEAWIQGKDTVPGYADFLINDTRISNLFDQARQASTQLSSVESRLGPKHPDVQDARARLQASQSELSKAIADRKKALALQRRSIQAQQAKEKQLLGKLLEEELQYVQLERQREAAEDIYTLLTQRYEEIRIEEAGITPDIAILEEPTRARMVHTSPKYIRIPGLGLLIGLLVGFGAVLILEYIDNTISDPETITRKLGLKVVSTIPKFGAPDHVPTGMGSQKGAVEIIKQGPFILESFRITGLNLGLLGPKKLYKTLCITSPVAGEGKTTIAANLAASLALAGQKVLLVDADARAQSLTELFNASGHSGMFDVLLKHASVSDSVIQTRIQGLSLMPKGSEFADPVSVFSGNAFKELVQQLVKDFDIVIFDAPPVLLLADPGLLAPQLEATVLVCKAHSTEINELQQARDMLISAGASVVGVILNMVRDNGSYGYYRKYYYNKEKSWWKRFIPRRWR